MPYIAIKRFKTQDPASRFYKVWIPKTQPSVFSTLRLTNCQFSAWSRLKGSQTSYHSNPGVLKNFRIYYTRMYRGKGGGMLMLIFFSSIWHALSPTFWLHFPSHFQKWCYVPATKVLWNSIEKKLVSMKILMHIDWSKLILTGLIWNKKLCQWNTKSDWLE